MSTNEQQPTIQNKRNLEATSPDSPKNCLKTRKMDFNFDALVEMMDELLDRKLAKLAKTEDLTSISKIISELKVENAELKEEVALLKIDAQKLQNVVNHQQRQLDLLDKQTKRNNVVVSGLVGGSFNNIKEEVDDLLSNVLEVEVKSFHVTKLNKEGTRCCVQLDSALESQLILKNSMKLKGTKKYIRRDWTQKEEKCRYHVRNLRRACVKKQGVHCRMSGSSITIDGKRFVASDDGTISANEEEAASYLRRLLEEVEADFDVRWNQLKPVEPPSQS